MNKSVLKKLFSEKEQSVELSEVQVDLALIDDLKKALSGFRSVGTEHESIESKYNQLSQEAKSLKSRIDASRKLFVSLMSKFEASAKDLGINVNDSIEYGIARENVEIANAITKKIDSLNLK